MTEPDSLSVDIVEKPVTEKPAKRWRNKWRQVFRGVPRYGNIFWSEQTWPSKDVAEAIAAAEVADNFMRNGYQAAKYLGAFPEGTTP